MPTNNDLDKATIYFNIVPKTTGFEYNDPQDYEDQDYIDFLDNIPNGATTHWFTTNNQADTFIYAYTKLHKLSTKSPVIRKKWNTFLSLNEPLFHALNGATGNGLVLLDPPLNENTRKMNANKLRKLIRERIRLTLEKANNPKPAEPAVKPDTDTPSKPRRRTLKPPKEAPETAPKAKANESEQELLDKITKKYQSLKGKK